MSPISDKDLSHRAETMGLRICKNCFRIKSHMAYKGGSRVCRKCKGQKSGWEEKYDESIR